MTLAALIRKRDTGNLATAIPAIHATQQAEVTGTVARVATVAVANPPDAKPATMTVEQQADIRAWLAHIEETDPAIITEVMDKCRTDPEALAYFTWRAGEVPKPVVVDDDDRRRCDQCANLSPRGLCMATRRGEVTVHYQLRRCVGYAPRPDDPDRRHGEERWPGLM
ncbi:MAG: hypothetical protein ACYDC8_08705 [Gammaproteobacteria bacterium]